MKEYNHLAENLRNYKAIKDLTTKELSNELDIPEATLRNVMKEGNTTLDTVIRISNGLDISLGILKRQSNSILLRTIYEKTSPRSAAWHGNETLSRCLRWRCMK